MKNIKTLIAILIPALFIVGCGGGGGDDDNNDNLNINTGKNASFSGTWNFNSELTVNTCRGIVDADSNVNILIKQNGRDIEVISNDRLLTGEVAENDSGFSAAGYYSTEGCNVIYALAVTDVIGNMGDASLAIQRNCPSYACSATYDGTIRKIKN